MPKRLTRKPGLLMILIALAGALPRLALAAPEEPSIDHRYRFPNGNELVFVPGERGFRMEKDGKIINPFPELKFPVKVFPSTDSTEAWAQGIKDSTFISDVPSAPIVFLEVMGDPPKDAVPEKRAVSHSPREVSGISFSMYEVPPPKPPGPEPWILSMTQDGHFTWIMKHEPQHVSPGSFRTPVPEPRWKQLHHTVGERSYAVLVDPSSSNPRRFMTVRVVRDDIPDFRYEWHPRVQTSPDPAIVDGKLRLERGGLAIDILKNFEQQAKDFGFAKSVNAQAILRELQQVREGVPEAKEPKFAAELLPKFSAGLEITADNVDLETARTFVSLKQRHEQMIPTLIKIAKEKPSQESQKVGAVNRSVRAAELMADYAELDPRALEALDQIAAEGVTEKARQTAQLRAKKIRKDLLSPEGQAELMSCMKRFRSL